MSENLCPVCHAAPTWSCRCMRGDASCAAGHIWTHCLIHDELVQVVLKDESEARRSHSRLMSECVCGRGDKKRMEAVDCPACGSTAPHLHPSFGHGGEVQPCWHPFHAVVTPENTKEKIASITKLLTDAAKLRITGQSFTPEPQPRVGVALFLFNDLGQYLVMQRKGSHGAGSWGLPGGHLEFGEMVTQAVVRETAEEIGIKLEEKHIQECGSSECLFRDEQKHYITILCKAWLPNGQLMRIMEPEKCDELRWVYEPPPPIFGPLRNYLAKNMLTAPPR